MSLCIRTLLLRGSIGLFMMIVAPIAALAQLPAPAPATAPASTAVADQNYIIGPGDVVEVVLLERTDFSTRAKVSSDGMIQLPYIGSIKAADRTIQTLNEDIKAALIKGGYFAKPNLRVEVVSFASRYVTVLGAVGAPGLVPIDRAYRLSEILARVGGVHEGGADYVIVRPAKGEEHRYVVKTLAIGDVAQDPFVSPGDTVYAPQAEMFYISGQVRSPGAYSMMADLTVRTAIGRSGGLTDLGSEKGIKIMRGGVRVPKVTPETKVAPGDIIVIGERLF